MFDIFSHSQEEVQHNNETSPIINYNNHALLVSFLRDLTFWEQHPSTSSRTYSFQQEQRQQHIMSPLDYNSNHRNVTNSCSNKPNNKKNAALCYWKSAVDPRSNQVYYYHVLTRETTWEKPTELRALEKAARKAQRKRDRLFFREMEQNIYASLKRGELIPPSSSKENKENVEKHDNGETLQEEEESRVRTISGMDNVLLAQLEKPKPIVKHTSTGTTSGNRPPGLPPRPNHKNSSKQDSMDLSSDESVSGPAGESLKGEHLLDGPIEENVFLGGELPRPASIHKRRNTGGTIFVKSTMTSPNIEATIKCVCGVFRAHILQACSSDEASKQVDQDNDVFCDNYGMPKKTTNTKNVPSLSEICSFYQDFYSRSQMEHDTIIMSLIYVERLIKEASIAPNCHNWMSVLFSCMVLASKVWDDLSMWNIDFSHVCGKKTTKSQPNCFASFTLARINQLELALLKSLNFNVKVPASEYAKYYFLIRSMLIKSGLLDEVVTNEKAPKNDNDNNDQVAIKPLDMQGAKNLETLSSNYQESFATRQEFLQSGAPGKNNRRSKSMDGYFWFHNNNVEARQPTPSRTCGNNFVAVGPVLNQSVCLEQLVSM